MKGYCARVADLTDVPAIGDLYRHVAAGGGLGRTVAEITDAYIADFVTKSLTRGLICVVHPVQNPAGIIGEIHGYTLGLKTFAHVLEQVTMAVHPEYQGQGLGKSLLNHLQAHVQHHQPGIQKVELMCFGNNEKALNLYLRSGFGIEGRRKNRVRQPDGTFTDGIALGWFNPGYNDI
jgi:ribosomal protein S18 acetylase RimI-like enzyme